MIIRCLQWDLLRLPQKEGQIYFATDTRVLYKDYGPHSKDRLRLPALILNTENERQTKIRPDRGRNYYVIDSNNLWTFSGKWDLKDGDVRRYNAYGYAENVGVTPVISESNYITSSETGDRIIDNNGLLGDGSVVVRDQNRIIKGIMQCDNARGEVAFMNYLDNGIAFYPYGLASTDAERKEIGALHLGIEAEEAGDSLSAKMLRKGKAIYKGNLYVNGTVYQQSVADSAEYQISDTPDSASQMTHMFQLKKEVTSSNGTRYFEYYDFTITVKSETTAEVKVTRYTDDTTIGVTGEDDALIHNNTLVWGEEITYVATRQIEASNKVSYILNGVDQATVITLEGTPDYAATILINENFSEGTNTVVARTTLVHNVAISTADEVSKLQSQIEDLMNYIKVLENKIDALS